MSPFDSLRWAAFIAGADLPLSACRLAMLLANLARDGRCMHGTEALAKLANLSWNGAAKGLDALVQKGFLSIEKPATQHRPAVYRLTGAGISQTPTKDNPDPQKTRTLDKKPDPHGRGTLKRQTPTTVGPWSVQTPTGVGPHKTVEATDPLARIKKAGARMTSQGNSLNEEWQDLIAVHGMESLLAALHRLAPKDRWPSKVRQQAELAADLPGLSEVTDPDLVRAALGLPPQNKDATSLNQPTDQENAPAGRELALAGAV